MDEGRLWTGLAGGFEQVERPYRVRIEIVKWNGRSSVMAWLGCCVHDNSGAQLFDQRQYCCPIADINLIVKETRQFPQQPLLVPPRVPLRTEENNTLVVIHTVNPVT